MKRAAIISEARSWIGTPYRHQASLKGAGCDCLGLVRGIWRAEIGREPETLPPYRADWGEPSGREHLLIAMGRHFRDVPLACAESGDVLIFRMQTGAIAKHCGVMISPTAFVHAYYGHSTIETRLGPWWQRRAVAASQFPGLEE